ncbi:MAG: dTDP-4-amino-4,6-dideoxyglucose formyltransferase [Reichenbachiella sp.]
MKIAIITDNEYLFTAMKDIATSPIYSDTTFRYYCSPTSPLLHELSSINVKEKVDYLINNFQLIISLHCKQLFPKELVKKIRCVNVHPGYNPYNRGWYPQVFSIINNLPIGATIHEIDDQLDHGKIITQEIVKQEEDDTSLSLYNRVQTKEIELLKKNLRDIIDKNYESFHPEKEGNINLKKDFNKIKEIDLSHRGTFSEHLAMIRALSHGDFKNAFFYNENRERIYIKLSLEKEK